MTTLAVPPTFLSAHAGDFDVVLCDIWGVLHDGVSDHREAGAALARFRDGGGTVVLISNSPRTAPAVADQLDGVGVVRAAWDGIVTSGDLTAYELTRRGIRRLHHVGPPRDIRTFAGLGVDLVGVAEAEIAVVTGLDDDDHETPDDYRERLAAIAARGLTLICANPDRVVERGDRLIWCAGALADIYREIGGEVVYAGKPYPAIYRAALAVAGSLRPTAIVRERVLAIGDAVATDLRGALDYGIAALFVSGGIHGAELGDPPAAAGWERLIGELSAPPLGWMRRLRWDGPGAS
jgi:HAD superfamily hydrolase (TIGR01459 family)